MSDAIHFSPGCTSVENTEVDDDELDGLAGLNPYLHSEFISVNDFRPIVGAVADNLVSIQATSVHQILEEWRDCLHVLLADCLRMWLVEELP